MWNVKIPCFSWEQSPRIPNAGKTMCFRRIFTGFLTVSFQRCFPFFLRCMLGHFSHVWLFATSWTVAYQAPLSKEFSRHECWSGLPLFSPGDLSDTGIELRYLPLLADTLPSGHFLRELQLSIGEKEYGLSACIQTPVLCLTGQMIWSWHFPLQPSLF